MKCPNCGAEMVQDVVDVGVCSVPTGPLGCPECWYVPSMPELNDQLIGGTMDQNERKDASADDTQDIKTQEAPATDTPTAAQGDGDSGQSNDVIKEDEPTGSVA